LVALEFCELHCLNAFFCNWEINQSVFISHKEVFLFIAILRLLLWDLYWFQAQEIALWLTWVYIWEFNLHGYTFGQLIEYLKVKLSLDA
jgi:hypothetical protein